MRLICSWSDDRYAARKLLKQRLIEAVEEHAFLVAFFELEGLQAL
jgi:hypothetical protein